MPQLEATINLPDPTTVYKLLKEAPGPSPWSCSGSLSSARGPLVWKKVEKPAGFNLLIDGEGRCRLALPMYIWFRTLDNGGMLLWSRPVLSPGSLPAPITVQLLNLDHLRRLSDVDQWVAQKPTPHVPHFSIAPEHTAFVELSPAYSPGRHELSLPRKFATVPEFFIVAENPALPKQPGGASFCIYAVNPAVSSIEVYPQDWFNDGTPDYGYQWITCATRDPTTRRLLVSGIRIDNFVLDETGSAIAQRLLRIPDLSCRGGVSQTLTCFCVPGL